jgi:hypothetical protein
MKAVTLLFLTVHGQRNIASYSWNEVDNKIAEETTWGTLPVFGIQYGF